MRLAKMHRLYGTHWGYGRAVLLTRYNRVRAAGLDWTVRDVRTLRISLTVV